MASSIIRRNNVMTEASAGAVSLMAAPARPQRKHENAAYGAEFARRNPETVATNSASWSTRARTAFLNTTKGAIVVDSASPVIPPESTSPVRFSRKGMIAA